MQFECVDKWVCSVQSGRLQTIKIESNESAAAGISTACVLAFVVTTHLHDLYNSNSKNGKHL